MTTDPPFDPTAPLAGPPEPWESAPTPSRRSGPPYHMTDMIAAEPALAGRILDRLADRRGPCRDARGGRPGDGRGGRPGHRDRLRDVRARGARGRGDPARGGGRRRRPGERLDPGGAGLRALAGAAGPRSGHRHHPRGRRPPPPTRPSRRRDRPARTPPSSPSAAAHRRARWPRSWSRPRSSTTAGVTPSATSARSWPAPRSARTCPVAPSTGDRRRGCWPMAPATRPGRRRSRPPSPMRRSSWSSRPGSDRPAGRELVLKVEEASWLPSAYRDLETFLHGHLPATGPTTGLVLVLTDRDQRAERLDARPAGPRRGTGDRPSRGRHRRRRPGRCARSRADAGRPSAGVRGARPCRLRWPHSSAPPRRSSS